MSATTVVSGRVNADVKRRVDEILARAGKTPGEVIQDLWLDIYETGELPKSKREEDRLRDQRYRFQKFMEFVRDQPPTPEWLINLTDQELNEMMARDLLEDTNE